jgi:tetratricopeptide (TPR) repeat protein
MDALGDNADALKNYTRAIELEEQQKHKSEWPYIYLSAFYNRQKNAAQALSYARKAIAVNPHSDTVYFEMAKAYRTQKELAQVPDYYYVLGLGLRELGNQKERTEALTKYAQLQKPSGDTRPEHPEQEPLTALEPQIAAGQTFAITLPEHSVSVITLEVE